LPPRARASELENSLNFFSEENKTLFNGYRVLTLLVVMWGSVQDLGTVFAFADVTMGLLALVNLIAIVLLFKIGLRVMRDHEEQIQAGVQPVFTPGACPRLAVPAK
jgi:alanine or glycine:cation symporter, AGCS family